VVLLALLMVSVMAGGTFPQAARLEPAEVAAWERSLEGGEQWLAALRLSDIFGAPWFKGLALLLLINLLAGSVQWVGRHRRQGSVPPPWRWGAPLGHLGLAVVVAAGLVSSHYGFSGYLELTEGEVFDGSQEKITADRGRFSGFSGAVRLDGVEAALFSDGRLRDLKLALTWQQEGGGVRKERLATNQPVPVAGFRLYPANTFGQSAVLERRAVDGGRRLLLVNFPLSRSEWGGEKWRAEQRRVLRSGGEFRQFNLVLHGAPVRLELEVRRGSETLYQGAIRPGESIEVAGERLLLRDVRPWAGIYVNHDPAVGWIFLGMVLALFGFGLHLLTPGRSAETAHAG